MTDESRQAWLDDKQHKLDVRLKRLEAETNPRERKKLLGSVARYRALLTLGPEGASAAAEKAAASRLAIQGTRY